MIVQYYVKSFARQAAATPFWAMLFFGDNLPKTASFSMFKKQDLLSIANTLNAILWRLHKL